MQVLWCDHFVGPYACIKWPGFWLCDKQLLMQQYKSKPSAGPKVRQRGAVAIECED